MSPLRQALADYLRLRRSLGYKLERPEKLLNQFISYLEEHDAPTVTTVYALAWARLPEDGDPNWWAQRLSVVRGFATYLRTVDEAVEVPPPDVLPWKPHRANPYLYSDEEITALIEAAATLSSPLRVLTYQTLVGLLAVTGIRVGEAILLDRDDFDARHGVLVIRRGKFGKARELPLHETSAAAVRRYLRHRDRHRPPARTRALLISPAGTRLLYCNIHWTFQRMLRHAGIGPRSSSCRPRIHDLRHSFAVRSLLEAHQNGLDVPHRLTMLATYLGHLNPAGTYWYLSASPELLALAVDRLERQHGGR